MYLSGDDWWLVPFAVMMLWLFLGPFLMAAAGAWYAYRPGRGALLWSVVPALVAVAAPLQTLVRSLEWGRPGVPDTLVSFLLGYVGLITVLPWLGGWGLVRTVRVLRARRARKAAPGAPPGWKRGLPG
ncbi:hypothetical protein AB0G74_10195 [Streptomyces sp. NPDC020875]|uniref:hypothetical protein n=1 Tax=Streptomyces sp. NPDC020875 TaxID=3154898 RepID=UPI0033CB9CD2